MSTFRIAGRVALVVGAGPGLGTTLGRRFADEGCNVALVARSEASLDAAGQAARAAGADPLLIPTDVTDLDAVERMTKAVMDRWGRIDILVNTAFGSPKKVAIADMTRNDLESWRQTVEVGGFGTLLTCHFVAPHMVRSGSGAIVHVTSMSSRVGQAQRSDYSAGKVQSHRIAQSLALELGPFGIRVNSVAPGHISSDRLEGFYRSIAENEGVSYQTVLDRYTGEMALRRLVTEDDVANAVLFLASDFASGITGAVLDVNAGHYFTP